MGLEKVVESIRTSGRRDADRIVEDARREARALVDAAEQRARDIVERRRAEAAVAGDSLRRREVAAAHLEAKKLRLDAEREALARLRAEVETRVARLPADDRKAHVKALAARAGIPGGRVLVAKQDSELARAAGVTVAGTFDGLGGVIVESADGTTREDFRYENVLDDVWRASLHEVAGILFEGK